MPITRPENYPEDWPAIREAVIARSGGRCELCGAPNGARIRRSSRCAALWIEVDPNADMFMARPPDVRFDGIVPPEFSAGKSIRVVLTVAHLDPTYQSHDPKHMLHLCQRCHLKIDAHLRWARRREKKTMEAVK